MELPTPKRNNLFFQLLLALAFAIPWAKRALPSLIVLVLLIACYDSYKNRTFARPATFLAPLGLCALFLLMVAGLTYTEHPETAINELGIKLSFLVFPLLAFITPSITRENIAKIQHAFISGCFLFIGIATAHASFHIVHSGDFYFATYDRLSWYIHPTYVAQYQAFTVYLLAAMALNGRYLFNKAILHFGAIVLALVFIVLLSSKAGYISALLVMFIIMVQAIGSGVAKSKSIAGFLLAASLFILIIFSLPISSARVENAIADIQVAKQKSEENDTTPAQGTSTQMRIVTWRSALTVLMAHPLGTGTGDTQHALNAIYRANSETLPAEKNLNAHNQFLQFGAELGWPGLLMLLLILYALWKSHGGDYSVRAFALICALNFLFESTLEAQAGIVFFSFWVMVYSKIDEGMHE